MTKSRIEGLIATFPKLVGEGKQHTFVETESVRYVYQPLEKLYVLLITTKASNILEDLETLRLFARVIPEYARGTTESDILTNAFQLIFAFDEIVALGYREDVNMSQIRTFTEMDSHEERVFRAVQESKEREAKEVMKQKARDLQLARQEAAKRGTGISGLGPVRPHSSGYSSDMKSDEPIVVSAREQFGSLDTALAPNIKRAGGGMKLGAAPSGMESVDKFVDRLKAEGEVVNDDLSKFSAQGGTGASMKPTDLGVLKSTDTRGPIKKEDLHIRLDEKMTVQYRRDGGLEQCELQGIMNALALSSAAAEARVRVDTTESLHPRNDRQPPVQIQTHPNLDKKAFSANNWLQVKSGGKPFPVGQEVSVLRWRLQTTEESVPPITVNCWPNEFRGGFEVNIEYELQNTDLELHDVTFTIPLPPGLKPPAVGNCDGDYTVNARRTQLLWTLPVIDSINTTGSIEFTVATMDKASADADQFFPIKVEMHADKSFCGIRVVEALGTSNTPVPFSTEVHFHAEKYEVV